MKTLEYWLTEHVGETATRFLVGAGWPLLFGLGLFAVIGGSALLCGTIYSVIAPALIANPLPMLAGGIIVTSVIAGLFNAIGAEKEKRKNEDGE